MTPSPAEALEIDHYVPSFEIYIDDRELPREQLRDVIEVSYHDDVEGLDSFQLTVNNWDARRQCFKFSDEPTFLPGSKLELWLGYHGGIGVRRVMTGRVAELAPSFPSSGGSTLSITGTSLLEGLKTKKCSRRFRARTKISDIAKLICAGLQIDLVFDETESGQEPLYEELVQHNEYDIVFLMRLARQVGYELFLTEPAKGRSLLHFRPSLGGKPLEIELGYLGATRARALVEFSPTFSTAEQTSQVLVRAWNNIDKRDIQAVAKRADVPPRDPKGLGGLIATCVGTREETITGEPVHDQAEAERKARSYMSRIKQRTITATGRTIGHPDLRGGSIVHVLGVGERFSGRYFVTGTEHSLGSGGYTTRFTCRREEEKGD